MGHALMYIHHPCLHTRTHTCMDLNDLRFFKTMVSEMIQRVKALVPKPDDLNFITETHRAGENPCPQSSATHAP